MVRRLYCRPCGLELAQRQLDRRTELLQWGFALSPTVATKTVTVHNLDTGTVKDVPQDMRHFDCDLCGKPIWPNEACAAYSYSAIGNFIEWAHDYLSPEKR